MGGGNRRGGRRRGVSCRRRHCCTLCIPSLLMMRACRFGRPAYSNCCPRNDSDTTGELHFEGDGTQQELVPDHHPWWEVEAPYLTGPRQLEESLTIPRRHADQPFFPAGANAHGAAKLEAGSAGRKGVHDAGGDGDDDDHRQMRLRWRLHDGVGCDACFPLGQSSGEAIYSSPRLPSDSYTLSLNSGRIGSSTASAGAALGKAGGTGGRAMPDMSGLEQQKGAC
jgi:hypothetical protein